MGSGDSFKSGSGNLEFGSSSDDDGDDDPEETSAVTADTSTEHSPTTATESAQADSQDDTAPKYPYFVRRSNVTDERDVRLEAHVRQTVSDQEASFRNELADALDTGDISKTDAREFALLYAFNNPEGVAKLMREEGFGELD